MAGPSASNEVTALHDGDYGGTSAVGHDYSCITIPGSCCSLVISVIRLARRLLLKFGHL